MKHWKGLLLFVFALTVVFTGVSYIVNQKMAQKAVESMPVLAKKFLPPFVRLSYTHLETDTCVFSACLSAQNVTVQLPGNKRGESFVFNLGTVRLERDLIGHYVLSATPLEKGTETQNDTAHTESASTDFLNPIRISFHVEGTLQHTRLHDFYVAQNSFSATLDGIIDRKNQIVDLKGKTEGLSTFAKQFFPRDLHSVADFLFDDTPQDINVTTDDTWIRVLDFPLVSKSAFFGRFP